MLCLDLQSQGEKEPTWALIITCPIMTRCYNRHTKCINLILYLGFLQ